MEKVIASIIIATYNRNKILIQTIRSIMAQKFKSFELIIVDQSRKHDRKTQNFLANIKDSRVRYFKVAPPSLPAARNFGLKKARGDIIIYIDDDVLLDPGFIRAHIDSYSKKNIVAVAGRVVQEDKPISDTLLYFRKTNFGAGSFNYLKYGYVQTATGCNMSYKKDILLRIGGFDTNFVGNSYREESDVSFKITKLGYKILFNPNASLYHLLYPTGGCREKKSIYDNYIVYRNEMIFFLRHRPFVYFPYFFAGYFFKYVLNWELIVKKMVVQRLKVFARGFITGVWIHLFPKRPVFAKETL